MFWNLDYFWLKRLLLTPIPPFSSRIEFPECTQSLSRRFGNEGCRQALILGDSFVTATMERILKPISNAALMYLFDDLVALIGAVIAAQHFTGRSILRNYTW
jgi:hypothetical protein